MGPFVVKAEGTGVAPDFAEVLRAAAVLFAPETCHELRGLPSGRSRLVRAGDEANIRRAVADLASDRGVYYTLNPVRSDLGDHGAKNADVLRRRWLLIDCDPVKASKDDSATDLEKGSACLLCSAVEDDLAERSWPDPVLIDSGNGYHLLYRIDLPNDVDARKLLAAVLKRLAAAHNTTGATVDRKVHNAARISKLPGTWARKGVESPERPYRLSRLLMIPDRIGVVSAEQIRAVARIEAEPVAAGPSPFNLKATGSDESAYARSALEREVGKVAVATEGRNNQLYESALKLAGHVAGGSLDESEVRRQLTIAAERAGLGQDGDPREIVRAIDNAFVVGKETPKQAPERKTTPEGPSGEWQEPYLDSIPAPEPFPLDVLPPALAEFAAEGARTIGCPPDYFGGAILGVASVAIGRSVALHLKDGWIESPVLYIALVGDPGMAKSPVIALVTRPLWELHEALQTRYREEVRAARGDGDDAPVLRRVVVVNATVEKLADILRENPRGLVMVHDELMSWVAGMDQYKAGGKGNDRQFFLSTWSCSPIAIDRKSNPNGLPVIASRPFLSILGGITPAMLGELADAKQRDDGFIDRLLFACPVPVQVRWDASGLNPELLADWGDAIHRLWARKMIPVPGTDPRPFIVRFTDQALGIWGEWFDRHCAEAESSDFPAHLRGPWAKLRSGCARLALVLHLLHGVDGFERAEHPGDVTSVSVIDAIRLIDYFKCHAQRAHCLIRGSSVDCPDGRAILAWLLKSDRGSFSERDVKQNFKRRFAGDDRAPRVALDWLKTRHCIRPVKIEPAATGRPHSPVYEVNPSLKKRPQKLQNPQNPE